METAMQDIIQELDCENCRQKRMCNGTDLMNCYAKKRLTIKSSKPSLNSQKNQSTNPDHICCMNYIDKFGNVKCITCGRAD